MMLQDFVLTEYRIGKLRIRPIDLLLLFCSAAFALLLRSKVWMIEGPAETELSLLGDLTLPMKAAGIAADFILAAFCGVYVSGLTGSRTRGFLTFSAVSLLPPLVMSSAMWGTADGIWLCFFVLSLLLFGKRKTLPAGIAYFAAVLFGNAPLFVLPALLAFSLPWKGAEAAKERSSRDPVCLLAAGCLGGMLRFLLRTAAPQLFFMTAAEGLIERVRPTALLSYNYPNLYQLLGPDAFVSEYGKLYPAIAAAVGCGLFVYALFERKKEGTNPETFLRTCLVCALVLPFLLPGMHERAGLTAVIVSLILAMCSARYAGYCITTVILSFMAGAAFFRGESFLPLAPAALVQLLMILQLCCRGLKREAKTAEENEGLC